MPEGRDIESSGTSRSSMPRKGDKTEPHRWRSCRPCLCQLTSTCWAASGPAAPTAVKIICSFYRSIENKKVSIAMTAWAFFGCAMTAFGPPLALFVFTVAADPVRIIILILSAFFWLLSLLASSLLWFAVVPLREKLAFGLFFSVVLQEIFRLLIYALLRKADKVLRKLTENEHTRIFANRHILSYVVGLGFGIMSGAFSMVNVLADSLGPGTLGFNGEPPGFLMASAGLCLAMILCHTCWGVITFAGMNDRKYWMVAAVWGAHSLVSGLTLLNRRWVYAATLTPAYLVLLASFILAFRVADGSLKALTTGGWAIRRRRSSAE